MRRLLYIIASLMFTLQMVAENGSHLWLRQSQGTQTEITANRQSTTIRLAIQELKNAWRGEPVMLSIQNNKELDYEGFVISKQDSKIKISSPSDKGILYGAYHLLRMQAMDADWQNKLPVTDTPSYSLRILNHWDNLDGTIERGYAGQSLWQWEELPHKISPRYEAYARANASIGINGTVLNNVNASPQILSAPYLLKVKTLADIFRPYGIKVHLSVIFASPMALDCPPTADPLNKEVARWWKNKA